MKCGTDEELENVRNFYVNILGMSICREWNDGIMIDSGNGLIEVFSNGKGERRKGALRHIAFLTDNVDEMAEKVRNAGYTVFIKPNDKVIDSVPEYPFRMAFCYGPLGEEIEFFCEY
jgi:glyoxylase I family protein